MPTANRYDEESTPKRILPGETPKDPFAGFDEARAQRKAQLDIDHNRRYVSDERPFTPPPGVEAAKNAAQQLTAERGKTHGEFRDHAAFTQTLKDAMRGFVREDGSRPWDELSAIMKEALDMDAHKVGRILAGRADFKDHWADRAGYAQLVADRVPD